MKSIYKELFLKMQNKLQTRIKYHMYTMLKKYFQYKKINFYLSEINLNTQHEACNRKIIFQRTAGTFALVHKCHCVRNIREYARLKYTVFMSFQSFFFQRKEYLVHLSRCDRNFVSDYHGPHFNYENYHQTDAREGFRACVSVRFSSFPMCLGDVPENF